MTQLSIPVTPAPDAICEDLFVRQPGGPLLRLILIHGLHEGDGGLGILHRHAVHRIRCTRRILRALGLVVEDRDRVDAEGDRPVVDQALDRLAVGLLELVADRAHEVDVGVHRGIALAHEDRAGVAVDVRRLGSLARPPAAGRLVVERDDDAGDHDEHHDHADAHPDREPVDLAGLRLAITFLFYPISRGRHTERRQARRAAVGRREHPDAAIVHGDAMFPVGAGIAAVDRRDGPARHPG